MDIVTAVFSHLSSLIMGKGIHSSRPFSKLGQKVLGLTYETPESYSYCLAALLPAPAEGPRGDQLGVVTHPGRSRQVCFFPCLMSVKGCSRQTRQEATVHGIAVAGAGRGRSRAESKPAQGKIKLVVI